MSSRDANDSSSDACSSDTCSSLMGDATQDSSETNLILPDNSLVNKNGIVWEADPPLPSRTTAENMMYNRFGVPPFVAQNLDTISDTFRLFFSKEMYDIILKYTNQCGENIYGDTWAVLDKTELDGFIGCLLLMGVHRDNHEPIKKMFSLEEGRKIYRDVFSKKRFEQLMRTLHFDDMETREIRKINDKFCHIRELWNIWVDLLIRNFRPFEDLCVDEQLVSFRGRCKFKQYMPMKPSKYGIKFFLLVDTESTYVSNICVYLGKRTKDSAKTPNIGKNTILHLVEPFYGSGRNVVCDNFFTSVELANELLSKKLTIVGTMRSNKRDIPPYLRPNKTTIINSSRFVFNNKKMILRYLPKKNKPMYMLCSSTTNVKTSTEPPHKPDIILYYNSIKGGVDTISRLLASLSVKRISRRWPLIVFFNIIDISLINAFCIYKKTFTDASLLRRDFLKKMADQLIDPLISRKNEDLVPQQKYTFKEITNSKLNRCRICERKYDSKTKLKCAICSLPCCKQHSKMSV